MPPKRNCQHVGNGCRKVILFFFFFFLSYLYDLQDREYQVVLFVCSFFFFSLIHHSGFLICSWNLFIFLWCCSSLIYCVILPYLGAIWHWSLSQTAVYTEKINILIDKNCFPRCFIHLYRDCLLPVVLDIDFLVQNAKLSFI